MTVEVLAASPTWSILIILIELMEDPTVLLMCVTCGVRYCMLVCAIKNDFFLIDTIFLPQTFSYLRVFNSSDPWRLVRDPVIGSRFIFGPIRSCILGSDRLVGADLKVDNHRILA